MEQRTCPVCGTTFKPRTWNHTYCTGFRGQCYRRAMNCQHRGGDLTAALPSPFDCEGCGQSCIPGRNVAAHATKFCGRRCKMRWHHARTRPTRGVARPLGSRPEPGRWVEGRCIECGERFIGGYRNGKPSPFCGPRCGRADKRRRRARRVRDGEPVHTHLIGERDEWTCGLCAIRSTEP